MIHFSWLNLIEMWAASLTSCIIVELLKHTRAERSRVGVAQVRPRPPAVVTKGETAADAATAAAIGAGGAVVAPLLGRAGVGCWAESRAIRSNP